MKFDKRLILPQCEQLQPVKLIHTNPWFSVKDRGGYFTTEYTEQQVIVLPIVDKHSIVMIRAIRPVINDNTIELPAGSFDINKESSSAGAARELFEETGIEIKELERFKFLTPLSVSPNRTPTLVHVFQIDLSQDEYDNRKKHDAEVASVKLVPFDKAKSLVLAGDIYVSVPVAIISKYLLSRI